MAERVAYAVTDDFTRRVASTFGEDGASWLQRLPATLAQCAEEWRLAIEAPFHLSYNYVAPATTADGTQVVVKLCPPNPEAVTEVAALRQFGSDGVCRLLEYREDLGVMLLERVAPGTPLSALSRHDDAEATRVFISICQRLWRPAPSNHGFPTVADWARGIDRHRAAFDGGSGPLPADMFEEGAMLFAWLLESGTQETLLHGDLHHDNILSSDRNEWLAIDPKGVVGEPGYELGAFLYNPVSGLLQMPDPERILADRIAALSRGLGMEPSRIRAWGIAQAVLSACWSVDDGQDWQHAMTVAGILRGLDV